ncbi:hypothetical protein [Priestia megaterium]|uniref:hypothetical protein n=1 Tax=Priestia megaterium TaxID=1404 RepID=UPI0020792BFB|nr:hypothetical protein [Priestia megaterium]USL39601.1 hypothetical protein LIT34_30175 [Priestia megaterium]
MINTRYEIGYVKDGNFYMNVLTKLNQEKEQLYKHSSIVGHPREIFDFKQYEGKAIAIKIQESDNHTIFLEELSPSIMKVLQQINKPL